MQSRYSYSIFFILGILVIVAISLSFRYTKSPKTSIPNVAETVGMDDTTDMLPRELIEDSWLGHVKKDLNQKSYFYAVSEIQLVLH